MTRMSERQIIAAMNAEDTDDQDNLIEALRNADGDRMRALLEKIRVAVRRDAVEAVVTDLRSESYAEAADFIESNY